MTLTLRRSFARALIRGATLTILSFGAVACGASTPGADAAGLNGLPLWEGHAREVFDDAIDAAAVGLSLETSSARSDRYLRERAQTADIVARVRVQTVTAESMGSDTRYHLSVQVGVPQLRKPHIPDLSVDVLIRSTSPSYGVAKAFDTRLQGRTFIGFLSRFAGVDGEPAFHFHLSPDAADVAAAVQDAVALGEIEGS